MVVHLGGQLLRKFVLPSTMSEIGSIAHNLQIVRENIKAAGNSRPEELKAICPEPRLVAVSKTKPVECLLEAYSAGQRHFGENYVQELVDKSKDERVINQCPDIKWHFIGHLQRSNVNKLLTVIKNLHVIETVDSEKLAVAISDGLRKKQVEALCNIYVQVNTSGEDTKSGIPPAQLIPLVRFIQEKCPQLNFAGLMTIGAVDSGDDDVNEDFKILYNCREEVCKELGLTVDKVELSMGMSGDYEKAVLGGSTNLRVGSTIFGTRLKKTS